MTQKLQEQPGALSVRKPQQRGTRATEDGGLGGQTAAGPGGTKAGGQWTQRKAAVLLRGRETLL